MEKYDVVIIGAGAAGLMCAIEAGKRGRRVLVLDHANKPGKKILMSGGGRCNFTNLHISYDKYISHNPHFCKSALSRYTQWDFIDLVKHHKIPFHEKTLGQLFCDHKSKDILDMLLSECHQANAAIFLNTTIHSIENPHENHFKLFTTRGDFHCESLVIACGGLSIPTMGASPFGYKIAEQFGLKIWPTRAGLVPFTLQPTDKEKLSLLSGISIASDVSYEKNSFRENILFTHRGLSGPAILQISSYWEYGKSVEIDLLPGLNSFERLLEHQKNDPNKLLKTILGEWFPKRMIEIFFADHLLNTKLASIAYHEFKNISNMIQNWSVKPNGTEGYRTAEVTLGGVDCHELSSKTMEVTAVKGLYFIGEVIDMTGWLGGYNFQWAWSSGWAAGQVV